MREKGCTPGHINESTLEAHIASGDVSIENAPVAEQCELVLQPGHHMMCVHSQLEPSWCKRPNRTSLQHLCRLRDHTNPSSGLWYIETRGQHSSDVRPSDLLGANRQPWSSGSVVLKCKYSSGGAGTYPHAFPSQCRYLLEPAPDAPPDRDAEESSSSTRRTQADLFAAIAERRKRKHA